jgi:hypothetical protein
MAPGERPGDWICVICCSLNSAAHVQCEGCGVLKNDRPLPPTLAAGLGLGAPKDEDTKGLPATPATPAAAATPATSATSATPATPAKPATPAAPRNGSSARPSFKGSPARPSFKNDDLRAFRDLKSRHFGENDPSAPDDAEYSELKDDDHISTISSLLSSLSNDADHDAFSDANRPALRPIGVDAPTTATHELCILLVRSFVRCREAGDADGAAALCTKDLVVQTPRGRALGIEAVKAVFWRSADPPASTLVPLYVACESEAGVVVAHVTNSDSSSLDQTHLSYAWTIIFESAWGSQNELPGYPLIARLNVTVFEAEPTRHSYTGSRQSGLSQTTIL